MGQSMGSRPVPERRPAGTRRPDEPPSRREEAALTDEAIGNIHSVKRRFSTGTSITRPKATSRQSTKNTYVVRIDPQRRP